jgi:hypothetical protein
MLIHVLKANINVNIIKIYVTEIKYNKLLCKKNYFKG